METFKMIILVLLSVIGTVSIMELIKIIKIIFKQDENVEPKPVQTNSFLSDHQIKEDEKQNISPFPVGTFVKIKGSRNKHQVISDCMRPSNSNEVKVVQLMNNEVRTTTWINIQKWEVIPRCTKKQ